MREKTLTNTLTLRNTNLVATRYIKSRAVSVKIAHSISREK